MSNYCAVCETEREEGSGISFHKFPLRNEELLSKWLKAMNKEDFIPKKTHVLCSQHFKKEDFVPCQSVRRLKENAVPSIFHYSPANDTSNVPLLCTNVIFLIEQTIPPSLNGSTKPVELTNPNTLIQTLPNLSKPIELDHTNILDTTLSNYMESAPMIPNICSSIQSPVKIKEENIDPIFIESPVTIKEEIIDPIIPDSNGRTYEELKRENELLRALVKSQAADIRKLEALCKLNNG